VNVPTQAQPNFPLQSDHVKDEELYGSLRSYSKLQNLAHAELQPIDNISVIKTPSSTTSPEQSKDDSDFITTPVGNDSEPQFSPLVDRVNPNGVDHNIYALRLPAPMCSKKTRTVPPATSLVYKDPKSPATNRRSDIRGNLRKSSTTAEDSDIAGSNAYALG
jgi:hypothetical protein